MQYNIFEISRKYGVKPEARQFRSQKNLFLVTFKLPALIMSENRTILGERWW